MNKSIVFAAVFLLCICVAYANPILWITDENGNVQEDFVPGANVYIHGTGFDANQNIEITLTRPDSATESCLAASCHFRFVGGLQVSDTEGEVLYVYDLNGIFGNYSVFVTDGANSASTHFTDARSVLNALVNGQNSTSVNASDSVSVTVSVNTTGSGGADDWESTHYRIGNSGPFTCANHNDFTSGGIHTTSFNINAPNSIGVYNLSLIVYGDDGCTEGPSNTFVKQNAIIVTNNAACGNGNIETPEQCDDGNTLSGDGCASSCAKEQGYQCHSEPSVCSPKCGDGQIVGNEQCDDLNDDDGDGCSQTCQVEEGWECRSVHNILSLCTPLNPKLPDACGFDVTLIMDSSGSMSASELSQEKAILNQLVDALIPLAPNEIAVVDFDSLGNTVLSHSSNPAAIKAAINGTSSGGNTNWEDALEEAHDEFDHRTNSSDLFIFASEGGANRAGDSPFNLIPLTNPIAVAAAFLQSNNIKLDNITIYTFGIGNTPDQTSLEVISSTDSYFDSDFEAVIAEIAQKSRADCCEDPDQDQICEDNCPLVANPEQEDSDSDGVGDACDQCEDTPEQTEVDAFGCSQEQFCSLKPWCGDACDFADWREDEKEDPNDCHTAIIHIEGTIEPRCFAVKDSCPAEG